MSGREAPGTTAAAAPARRDLVALLGILVLALVLRLPGYRESVWLDELFTSDLFCGDALTLLKTLYSDIHPPAYFVFIHFWNAVFGDSEVWLRLPPLLCGLASIVLVWRLGLLFADRGAGLLAAFLLAVSPVHIWYSQEARPYSTNILLLLVTLAAFYRLLRGRAHSGWYALYALALTGVVFTHYYMVAFTAPLSLFAWRRSPDCRRAILWIHSAIVAVLVAYMAAKSWFSVVPTSMVYLRAFELGEAWQFFFAWCLTGDSLTPQGVAAPAGAALLAGIQVLGVAAFARGAWLLVGRREPWGGDVLVYMLVLPAFLLGLALLGFDQTYIERSAVASLPLFLLVLAVGATGFRTRWIRHVVLGCTVAVATTVLVGYFAYDDEWTVYKQNPDWRSAARLLGESYRSTPGRDVMFSDYSSPTALTYYDERIREAKLFEPDTKKTERLLATTGRVFGEGGYVHEAIRQRLDDYAKEIEGIERQTEMLVYHLPFHDPLAAPAPAAFWLLVYGQPGEHAGRLLASDRLRVESRHDFRMLTFYRMVRRE